MIRKYRSVGKKKKRNIKVDFSGPGLTLTTERELVFAHHICYSHPCMCIHFPQNVLSTTKICFHYINMQHKHISVIVYGGKKNQNKNII